MNTSHELTAMIDKLVTAEGGTVVRAEGYADPQSNTGYTDHGGVPTKL